MLEKEGIELLADQFFSEGKYRLTGPYSGTISYPRMKEYLESYAFNKQNFTAGWATRIGLSYSKHGTDILYADEVHKWGFGGAPIADHVRNTKGFNDNISLLCRHWEAEGSYWENPQAMESFIVLMSIKNFKIARVSKLICFLNQDRYAIYDSRVSYALRKLTIKGLRVFPQVGGRPARSGEPPRVTPSTFTGDARRMARTYIDFLNLMHCFAERLNENAPLSLVGEDMPSRWNPSLVEMALFMFGEPRTRGDKLPRFCSYITRPWEPLSTFEPSSRGRALS